MDGLVRCEGLTDLREISLTEKYKYCMISLMCGFQKKKKKSKLVNRTEDNREQTSHDGIGGCWNIGLGKEEGQTIGCKTGLRMYCAAQGI